MDFRAFVFFSFMKVCEASSSGTPKVEAYSDSGLNLWVDLKVLSKFKNKKKMNKF